MKEIFETIYQGNLWGGEESVSGPGSDLESAREIIRLLPQLLKQYRIGTLLDVPCGDFNWMREAGLSGLQGYTGMDIVRDLIAENNRRYASARRRFVTGDLTCDPLPKADLILCRDCLVHFSYGDIWQALTNIKRSGAAYLLTTTFDHHPVNNDIRTGDWRFLNLQAAPFSFPQPLYLLREHSAWEKCLGLWKIEQIPIFSK